MFGFGGRRRPDFVAFDAIGTVFQLGAIRPLVVALGLPGGGLEAIYASALRSAFALAAAGEYRPFKGLFAAAIDEVVENHGLRAPAKARATVLEGLKFMPARPDAGAAFRVLRHAGIGVGVLSNGALRDTEALLGRTGLAPLVDLVMSTDQVGFAKPRAEPYLHAAKLAGLRPGRVALVAAHGWDVNGAGAAGLTTAYVAAERRFPAGLRRPDIEAGTLLKAARALSAL